MLNGVGEIGNLEENKTHRIKVSVIEDNNQVTTNLRRLFSSSEDFVLLDSFESAIEAIQSASSSEGLSDLGENDGSNPDIVVLDIGLPQKSGIEALGELKSLWPGAKFVMYTVFEDEENIIRAIKNGANGYLLKDTPMDLFLAELRVIHLGGSPLTPRIAVRIIQEFELKFSNTQDLEEWEKNESILSKREREVLNLVSLGLVYSDIADELDISPHTVSRHVEKIYKKLNVHTKSEAIIRGRRLGIIREGSYNI